jgi:Xaa-Pro aminopeptidase
MPTATTSSSPGITHAEHARRRKKLLTALRKSVGVIFAGDHAVDLETEFRPHPHFEYLTGVVDEPGAVLVLDPGAPVAARREMLFLEPLNPEVEKWDGYRLEVSQALRDGTGFKAIFRTLSLPRFLLEAARRSGSLACLHPIANHEQPVSPDLALFRKVAERLPGAEIIDRTDEVPKLRAVKSAAEVKMIDRAIEITRLGFIAAGGALKPGRSEFDVQEALEHAYRDNGSRGPAFGSIVGAGVNSTVLHYRANRETIGRSDVVCIDSGAGFGGYGADITRTFPANGRFTKRQREIYDIVLKAMNAAIRAVKPGAKINDLDRVARAIIVKAGYGDYFIHGIGHHLGLETHDTAPDAPLREGNVITVEPGIYIPDEAIGVRIEDDVLVTKTGNRNLSAKIPKTAAAVEKMVRGR